MAVLRESPWYQQILQEGEQRGLERGRQEGEQRQKRAVAVEMLKMGMSPETIARATKLTVEEAFATPVPEPTVTSDRKVRCGRVARVSLGATDPTRRKASDRALSARPGDESPS